MLIRKMPNLKLKVHISLAHHFLAQMLNGMLNHKTITSICQTVFRKNIPDLGSVSLRKDISVTGDVRVPANLFHKVKVS